MTAQAEKLKLAKYAHLDSIYFFVPFAVETSGVLGEAAEDFLGELVRQLCKAIREHLSQQHLLQRNSIAVQGGNAAAVLGTEGGTQLQSCE